MNAHLFFNSSHFFSVLTKFSKILRSSASSSSHTSSNSSCSHVKSGRIPSPAKNWANDIPNASQILSNVGTEGMLFLFIMFANAVCDISVSCASLYLEILCLLHNSFTRFGIYSSVRKQITPLFYLYVIFIVPVK